MSSVLVSLSCIVGVRNTSHRHHGYSLLVSRELQERQSLRDWCVGIRLLVVGIQMMLDSVMLEHLRHVFSVGDELHRSG